MNASDDIMLGQPDLAAALKGPILVLGGGGFVGANLVQQLLRVRTDVTAVVRRLPAWRLAGLDRRHVLEVDLISPAELRQMIDVYSSFIITRNFKLNQPRRPTPAWDAGPPATQ